MSHLPRTVIVLLTLVSVAGCGSSSRATGRSTTPTVRPCPRLQGPSERSLAATTAGVSRIEVVIADRNRSSIDEDCRLLRTQVRFPTRRTNAMPLIVVAHGLDGDPSALAPLLDAWAASGFVVAAPRLPITPKDERGDSRREESIEQARDLSFVITQLLAKVDTTPTDPLLPHVDPRRIGAAGMSLGGLAVYGLVSNSCCRDRRVDAAILMAAVRRQFPGDEYQPNDVPVFLVQGDADPGYHNSVAGYPELVAPKWFLTLHGSGHAPPFEVPPGPEAPLVSRSTTLFWERYLADRTDAANRLVQTVAASDGRATLQRDVGSGRR